LNSSTRLIVMGLILQKLFMVDGPSSYEIARVKCRLRELEQLPVFRTPNMQRQ
ncbi:hypothetical protein BAE44_0002076, partial [Dichanthelium oligosanthes]